MQPWRSLITFRTAADLGSSCSSKMIFTQRLKNPSNLSDGINPFPEHNEPGLSATRHLPSFSTVRTQRLSTIYTKTAENLHYISLHYCLWTTQTRS